MSLALRDGRLYRAVRTLDSLSKAELVEAGELLGVQLATGELKTRLQEQVAAELAKAVCAAGGGGHEHGDDKAGDGDGEGDGDDKGEDDGDGEGSVPEEPDGDDVEAFGIVVKTPALTFTVIVDGSFSVEMLKAVVCSREGTPRRHQRLTFGGLLLEDARSLSSYGVADQSEVVMSVPGCGGGASKRLRVCDDMVLVPRDVSIKDDDVQCIKDVLSIQEVKVSATLKTLTVERLRELKQSLEGKRQYANQFPALVVGYIPAVATLEDAYLTFNGRYETALAHIQSLAQRALNQQFNTKTFIERVQTYIDEKTEEQQDAADTLAAALAAARM